MSRQPDSDLQAELAALRQRLGDLEAEHRELQAEASLARYHVSSRKFVLSALAVVLLLTAVGVLYAVDALFITTHQARNRGNRKVNDEIKSHQTTT